MSQDPDARIDIAALHARLDRIDAEFDAAHRAIKADRPIDLANLGREIDLIAAHASRLAADERHDVRARLIGLLAALDRLAAEIARVRDGLVGSLSQTQARRQGFSAYGPRGAR